MRLSRSLAVAGTTLVLALTLTACGGSEDADDPAPDTESTSEAPVETDTETPSKTPSETESASETPGGTGGATASGQTPPGTELAIGEAAVVPASNAGNDGVVEVVVTGIEEGDPAVLAGLEGAEELSNLTLSIDGLDADGNPAAQLINFSAGPDDSEDESAPSDGDGTSFTSCHIVVSQTPVTTAAYGEGDDYSLILGTPVTWS